MDKEIETKPLRDEVDLVIENEKKIHKLAAEFDYIIDTVRNGDTVDTVDRARRFLEG